jgi:hypothetical protein
VSFLRRVLLVAAIAAIAVVPLRAFGVVGADPPSGLSVSASLGGCGVGGEGIVCTIDVSFTGVEGADYYTGTLTRADGSVQDLGAIGSGEGGGSASVSVPYVGAGTYSVTVSAWGSPEDDEGEKPELLDRERARTGEKEEDSGEVSSEPAPAETAAEAEEAPAPAAEETEPPPAETTPAATEPEPQTLPQCVPEPPAAEPASSEDGSAEADPVPPPPPPGPAIECTTPSADANGPCCPAGS